ncbi:MAG: cell division protein FtsH, partial [Verrucomicrobia bacterium]|nr:cell division protein FtsH [Verrucomicrobiota bacterium]
MSDEKQSGDKRRGFPGSFLIFLLVAVLIALTVQNFLSAKYANVSFSYQVQHLVNLELINPADSRMVALGDNLVTLSGRFRDRLTEEGKARYKYLELLDREDMLSEKKELLGEELQSARGDVISAAGWFLELSGIAVPQGGYVVTPLSPVAPEQGEAIVIENVPRRVTSLSQLQQRISSLANNPDDAAVKQFGSDLSNLVQNFRSPALGIGQENLKQQLRKIDKDVLQASTLPQGGVAAVEVFSSALQQLGAIVDELNT